MKIQEITKKVNNKLESDGIGGVNAGQIMTVLIAAQESGIIRDPAMELNEICNKVCGEIKEGWVIQIHLEDGAGYAELIDPSGHLPEFDSADMSIKEQVEDLLIAANNLPE